MMMMMMMVSLRNMRIEKTRKLRNNIKRTMAMVMMIILIIMMTYCIKVSAILQRSTWPRSAREVCAGVQQLTYMPSCSSFEIHLLCKSGQGHATVMQTLRNNGRIQHSSCLHPCLYLSAPKASGYAYITSLCVMGLHLRLHKNGCHSK